MTRRPSELQFRPATIDDLPTLISLLADDVLGSQRETADATLLARYEAAFRDICEQKGNQILLVVDGDEVLAMLQLTLIPGLSHQGGRRAQIESVRVKSSVRGQGIGKILIRKAIEMSREAGCSLVQLTTDHRRPEALRFYGALGFKNTHHGMKLAL